MREEVRLRVMQAAEHILETGATVRACAGSFGVSKTTIHKDMRERLPKMDADLSRRVDAVLRKNLQERHLRGGEATRKKYSALREQDGSPDCATTGSICEWQVGPHPSDSAAD